MQLTLVLEEVGHVAESEAEAVGVLLAARG